MKINISWSLLLILLEVAGTQSLCEFPSTFQGSYMLSKYNSVVNVNVSHIDGLGLIDAPLLEGDIGKQYDCLANNGSKYVIRSVLGDKLPSEAEFRYIFLCMDLTVVSDIKATFVQATKTGPGTKPYDVKFLKLSEVGSDPVSRICDIPQSSYLTTMYSVFLKTSYQSSWPQTCPTELLGVYSTQDPSCPASWDACVDNSYIQMDNTSSCTILPLFSANGSVICVHEVRSGNITFLHVYNNDNEVNDTNTFRYTCIALQKEGDTIQLSQNPGDCVANQRPDTATTLGKTTFSFTQPDPTKLCPVTSSSSPTTAVAPTPISTYTTVSPGLSTAATAGLVLGLLVLLCLVLLVVVCLVLWRRKKRMEVVDIKRRSEGREERRRRRRERRLRRMQEGLQPNGSDSDSSDSGYSGRSTTSLFRPEDGHGEHEDEARKSPEKKTRRVFDDEGNLLYEEIPRSSDQEEEEDDERGKRVKQKTKKKTRKYTKMKTLPDGTEVKEVIESDHWSTDSEKSSHSWTQDHVDLHLAKQRREKEHQSMVERSTGSNTKTLVTRPSHEKSKLNATLPFSLPGIFKYLAKGKRKLPEAPPGEEETPREADRYMEQYQDKKDTERRLDDEGFWEDPKSKKTALEIFDFDNLDSQLDESPSGFHTALDNTAGRNQHQDGACSRLSRHTAQSTESKNQTLPDIERPSSLDDTCDEMSVKSSDTERRAHEKTRMLASLSRLLTERLFYDAEADRKSTRAQSGKVIFVDEYRTQTPASQLPSRSKSRQSQSLLRHSHHAFGETSSDNMNEPEGNLRPGSQGVELPPLKRSGYSTPRHTPRYTPRFTPHGKRRLGADKAAALKYGLQQDRGYLMYLLRGPWPTREAWTGGPPDRIGRPWTVQRGAGGNNIRDTDDIDYTAASGDIGYLDIDDARLKRLLEELYGDKKYMDALLAAEETSSNEEVKALAEHGRNYLVQMALYWEEKGPLPPRPSVTALGFRMERAKTACLQSSKEAKIPTLQRNKTMD